MINVSYEIFEIVLYVIFAPDVFDVNEKSRGGTIDVVGVVVVVVGVVVLEIPIA